MHAKNKAEKLTEAKRLFFLHVDGITDIELAKLLDVDRASAYRYRTELGGKLVSEGRYSLEPTPADIELALAVLQRINHRQQP